MSTSSINTKSGQDKPTQTAQILEHVEMLLALQEDQCDRNSEGRDSQVNSHDELGDLLAEKAEEISKSLESQIMERIERLESKIEMALESNSKSLGNNDTQAELEQSIQKLTEQFGEKTESITSSFNAKIEEMFAELGSRVTQISQGISQHEPQDSDSQFESDESDEATVDEPANPEPASHWHKQKAAMLSKYGIDPEYRPVMELPASKVQESEEAEAVEGSALLATMSEDDAAEIASIKERLNEKLREAEVELSINRAKLSQKKAELESVQVDLDRRASAIEEKYAAVAKAPKKRKGIFERLIRHSGGKKKPDQDS